MDSFVLPSLKERLVINSLKTKEKFSNLLEEKIILLEKLTNLASPLHAAIVGMNLLNQLP